MSDELGISMRPRTFDAMIGSKKVIEQIRNIIESGKLPKAWMFTGETGAGKTTIARIMAISFQCRHQKVFGNPCKKCIKKRKFFDITNLNVRQRKVEDLDAAIEGSHYAPKPGSRRRVYILDEAQMLTEHSQNLLLDFFEDCPRTTHWIICTTNSEKIIKTLQSRSTSFAVPGLELKEIKQLVKRALQKLDSDRDVSDLSEKLMEKGITSPRLVLKAVQKYANKKTTADEAVAVTYVSDVDTFAICRSLIKGDWEAVAQILMSAKANDNVAIRASVAGYLNAMLLGDTDFGHSADMIAKAIIQLNAIRDDFPAMSAILYTVCKYFRKEKR